MRSLVALDHQLTTNIRMWGQPMYGFWKWVASQSIALFVVAAVVLAAAHELAAWQFGLAFVSAYGVAVSLQLLIKRHRPDFERLTGYKMWFFSYSYPSAHAATSAAGAIGLALLPNYASHELALAMTAGAVALTVLIGISRLVVGVHYFADVMFGWLVGFVVALGWVLILT